MVSSSSSLVVVKEETTETLPLCRDIKRNNDFDDFSSFVSVCLFFANFFLTNEKHLSKNVSFKATKIYTFIRECS